ncbi:hypothetical protein GP486_005482 [Trichoglossum hirsutum]|uniref:Uncharacterized protein n=1 Tax=Trichoglossum hirsutum TaxID=265104 RepID=A0A9P8L960_9PEZI|nr:hypothetical protein GP486_005482 [Trichoglossum hirsutum]
MSACSRSYGISVSEPFSNVIHDNRDRVTDPINNTITAKDQLRWLIKKGDLMLSNQPKIKREWFTISFQEHSPRDGAIPIYSYDYDDLPSRCGNALNELTPIHTLNYDLKDLPIEQFRLRQRPGLPLPFYAASLSLTMNLDPRQLLVELRWKDTVLCSVTIGV